MNQNTPSPKNHKAILTGSMAVTQETAIPMLYKNMEQTGRQFIQQGI
uniref:Uncharacterized protein n=1 Tax=Anguilla anguilla TaxID=7936 RepID=A0A0E9PKT8_ANGAN